MLKSVLGRALLCYVPKKKNLGRLIYRNDADIFTIFGKSSLIKPNCPDGERKLKINKYNFFSYYR